MVEERKGTKPERMASILLVEDEHRLRRTLVRSLEARRFQVEEATTAAEAVRAVLRNGHDVVLLDVNLPDATGWEVLRDLRQAGHRVPVVVLSAVTPNPARIREFRPHGVLLKPFPIDALLRLIVSAHGAAGEEISRRGEGHAPETLNGDERD